MVIYIGIGGIGWRVITMPWATTHRSTISCMYLLQVYKVLIICDRGVFEVFEVFEHPEPSFLALDMAPVL